MNHIDPGGMNRHELRITELSPPAWRVSDESIAEGDPSAVLGFIQQIKGAYEVTDLGRLRERTYFSSFARATSSFAGRKVMS